MRLVFGCIHVNLTLSRLLGQRQETLTPSGHIPALGRANQASPGGRCQPESART